MLPKRSGFFWSFCTKVNEVQYDNTETLLPVSF